MIHDLKYALRALLKTPGFTFVAVATLALGIGANTAVFSLLNAALFREVDAPESNRLVWLVGTRQGQSRFRSLSYPEYREHSRREDVFSGVMTYQDVPLALGSGSGAEPERIDGLVVTGNYFAVLGVRPQLGRTFLPEEDATPLTHAVVVLSDVLWRQRFGGDSAIVGRGIILNGKSYTVVGVAPPGFGGIDLGPQGQVFVPMAMLDHLQPENGGLLTDWNAGWLRAVGRLRPGVELEQARAAVRQAGQAIAAAHPGVMDERSASVEPLAGGLDPNNRHEGLPIFILLMAVPAMVLLIACSNAANLLLARAASRRREIGVRLALGASRSRLIGMLVAESLWIGLFAGVLGILSSLWIVDLVGALGNVPAFITGVMAPDVRVLAFSMTLALLTGLLFGLVPALGATRPNVISAIKEDSGGTRFHRSRLVSTFVVAQVSVSLVLLVVAGLFMRTLSKATSVDVGFDTRRGVTAAFDLTMQGYDNTRRQAFYEDLVRRAAALPGVEHVSLSSNLPLSSRMVQLQVVPEGAPPYSEENARSEYAEGISVGQTTVWPDFFRTLGIQLLAGRDFTMRDDATAPGVVIINQTLANRLWPGENAVGKRLRFTGPNEPLREVVAVSQDGKYDELTEDPRPYIYTPERQALRFFSDMTVVIRTVGDPEPMLPSIRALIHEMDQHLPVYRVRTLQAHVLERLDKERAASALLGAFGALALILAALGLYGVMSYAVAQRTREMGIRMAIGAARGDVRSMVVREGVRLAAVGIVVGLALSAAFTRVLARFLFGVTPTDMATFGIVSIMMIGIAAAASLMPARRATRVDPMVALRSE